MLDPIYHMRLKLLQNHIFDMKVTILTSFTLHYNGCHYITLLICKPLVVYQFYCMALYYTRTRRHVKLID